MKVCIAQFLKSPEFDPVKTRMYSALSPDAAINLHKNLARHVSQKLAGFQNASLEIWSTNGGAFALGLCEEVGAQHNIQVGANLGQRLLSAVYTSLQWSDAVILVGSDCPVIDDLYLDSAIAALESKEVVIGPASDGGYVLLGLKKPIPEVFNGVDWGSDEVFDQTIKKIQEAKLSYHCLGKLADIDRPSDLQFLSGDQSLRHLLDGVI